MRQGKWEIEIEIEKQPPLLRCDKSVFWLWNDCPCLCNRLVYSNSVSCIALNIRGCGLLFFVLFFHSLLHSHTWGPRWEFLAIFIWFDLKQKGQNQSAYVQKELMSYSPSRVKPSQVDAKESSHLLSAGVYRHLTVCPSVLPHLS